MEVAHYAYVYYPIKALSKNPDRKEWCHRCVSLFQRVMNVRNTCPNCSTPEQLQERKKVKSIVKPTSCDFCRNTPCDRMNCPRKCNTCKVLVQPGYNLEEGLGHRCIVRDIERFQPLWSPGDRKAKSYMDAKTQIWVYDFESLIKRIPGSSAKHYETNNHEFVLDENNNVITTTVERTSHSINMAICVNIFDMMKAGVQEVDETKMKIFKNSDLPALDQFMHFAISHNFGKNIFIAHNGSGYDTRFVYEWACKNLLDRQVKTIITGCKIMELSLNSLTKFRDSMLHLPGSLARLAKGFNLKMTKGYFPHLFNTVENQEYVGRIPNEGYFDMTFTAREKKEIDTFKEWFHEQR